MRPALISLLAVMAQLAPGGTFIDDNGLPQEAAIEAVVEAGLMQSCNPPTGDRFCPDAPADAHELDLLLATFVNPLSQGFASDFPNGGRHLVNDAIRRALTAAFVAGCNATDESRSCGERQISRAEMAGLMARAFGLEPMKPPPATGPGAQFWSSSSPFNTPIPDDPRLDPGSREMVDHLSSQVVFDLYEFGIAIHYVDSSTPVVNVTCRADWGVCPTDSMNPIPVPTETSPPPGSDGNTALVDWSQRRVISMHQPRRNWDGSWSATWVTVTDLQSSGFPPVGGNGSGAAHHAGVVELHEIEEGVIEHALVFSTSEFCEDEFRPPATKTDGESDRRYCIPAGARVQLDPDVDIESLDLNPGELAVAHALQTYGAYAVDRGGAPMALYFQVAPDATRRSPGQTYIDVGLVRDYYRSEGIPWDDLRVLAAWDGS